MGGGQYDVGYKGGSKGGVIITHSELGGEECKNLYLYYKIKNTK
jgi:hypothetical protein